LIDAWYPRIGVGERVVRAALVSLKTGQPLRVGLITKGVACGLSNVLHKFAQIPCPHSNPIVDFMNNGNGSALPSPRNTLEAQSSAI
jgi:hypothetical protein